jgi:hypothetical protein
MTQPFYVFTLRSGLGIGRKKRSFLERERKRNAQRTLHNEHCTYPNLRSFSFVVDRMALFALLNGESW